MHPVRCPSCQKLSRVGADAVGRAVACPHCNKPFTANPEPAFTPRPRPRPAARPVLPPPVEDDIPTFGPAHPADAPHAAPSPTLIGLILLPFGIPLLWLMGPLLTGKEPIFSFAAPVALAVGLAGLGLGIAFAHGWTVGTRLRAVLALVLVGYFTGGFLYFLKKEWAEALRRDIGPANRKWKDFELKDTGYKVSLPGTPQEVTDDRQMPGWALKAHRWAEGRKGARDSLDVAFEVAHGTPPDEAAGPKLADEEWFASARAAVIGGCDGRITRETTVAVAGKGKECPGREFVLELPDRVTNRIVRVYRVGPQRAVYLAVEGWAVLTDADYVQTFFTSLAPK